MKLSIHARSIEITDALRDLISRRLRFAFDAFNDSVTNTAVYLEDINGPRGGVDNLCHITVAVRGAGNIRVKASGPTPSAALTRAARGVKYRVAEALRRLQRPPGESIRKMAPAA